MEEEEGEQAQSEDRLYHMVSSLPPSSLELLSLGLFSPGRGVEVDFRICLRFACQPLFPSFDTSHLLHGTIYSGPGNIDGLAFMIRTKPTRISSKGA